MTAPISNRPAAGPSSSAGAWPSGTFRDEGRCLCGCGCDVERDFLASTHCGLCQLRIHAEYAEAS